MMVFLHKACMLLVSQLLLCRSIHSLLSTLPLRRTLAPKLLLSICTGFQEEAEPTTIQSTTEQIILNNDLISYSFYWDSLLTKEYQDTAAELQARRKSYSRSELEASGLALFNVVATPETELYGEKIVRISSFQQSHSWSQYNARGSEKLREKFKRGDVLVMTPEIQFRGKDIPPREGMYA